MNKKKIATHDKVWGKEYWIVNTPDYCGKKLVLNEGCRCSIHYHKVKDETFYVISGKVLLKLNTEEIVLKPGDSIHVKPGNMHRFTGLEKSEIIEFSTYHEDDDSFRCTTSCKIGGIKFAAMKKKYK